MDSQERSEAQREASRRNGAQGCGPTSEEGRQRAARNSTRHGLFSSRVVLANESQELFDQLLQALLDEHQPVGPTEQHLVEDMAIARWKIRRLHNMEAAGYDTDMFIHHQSFNECFQPNDPGMRHHDAATSMNATAKGMLEFYDRSHSRLHRVYRNSLSDLLRLQARRGAAQPVRQEQPASKTTPDLAPQPAPHPAQTAARNLVDEILRNEPKTPPTCPPIHLKTYVEPEIFAFLSKVDTTKLNPLCFRPAKQGPAKDDFSQFFEPAA